MIRFKLARTGDLLIAVFLLLITALLLFPLPTWLLDFLLVINLAFSLLLLLAGLYMSNALALLSFPALLLLTTLFRLGLNVASSRLILSQGDAGSVIQAFGSFLIQGEVLVGLILFFIITTVNFIVVARGATRVSEVAARFALDALPGKQLSIDSDLRSGLISAEEAQLKRENLRKESQLYGAMDGSMKFVQGDAIAGLIIIATNIIGGIYLGLKAGMSFGQAVDTYTILTVGDGLVNQIPAILISVCAGIVVTRVGSSEESSLGTDVQTQIFMRPGAMAFTGGLVFLIGLLPFMPQIPFLTVGALALGLAWFQWKKQQQGQVPELNATHSQRLLPGVAIEEPLLDFGGKQLEIRLDTLGAYPKYVERAQAFHMWWERLQTDFYSETGLSLPALKVVPDVALTRNSFSLVLNGVEFERGELFPHAVLLEMNPLSAEAFGFEIEREALHPFTGARIVWVQKDPVAVRLAEAGDIGNYDPFEFLALKVVAFLRKNPEETLSLAQVLELERQLEKQFPGLLGRALNQQFFSPARLLEILHELARGGLSIKDFLQLIESVASYESGVGAQSVQENEYDLEGIIEHVRKEYARPLVASLMTTRRTVKAITLSSEVEAIFEELPMPHPDTPLGVAPDMGEKLRNALKRLIEPVQQQGFLPIAVLCRSELRSRVSRFLGMREVFSFDELTPGVGLEPLGVWKI